MEKIDKLEKDYVPPLIVASIARDVGQNQVRFDQAHKGKKITVEGYVSDIEEVKGGYSLKLRGSTRFNSPFEYLELRFDAKHKNAILDLNKDDSVIVQGTYRGKQRYGIGTLTLFSCEVVE